MAGNDHRDRILPYRCADRARRGPVRLADTPRDLPIRRRRTERDVDERTPHALLKRCSSERERQIERAFALAFNRPPEPQEARDAMELVESHGLPSLCRALLNANELVFIPLPASDS